MNCHGLFQSVSPAMLRKWILFLNLGADVPCALLPPALTCSTQGLDEARNQLAAAISDAQAATAAKEAAEVAAESRVADVSAQNAALHEQLEKMAAAQQARRPALPLRSSPRRI